MRAPPREPDVNWNKIHFSTARCCHSLATAVNCKFCARERTRGRPPAHRHRGAWKKCKACRTSGFPMRCCRAPMASPSYRMSPRSRSYSAAVMATACWWCGTNSIRLGVIRCSFRSPAAAGVFRRARNPPISSWSSRPGAASKASQAASSRWARTHPSRRARTDGKDRRPPIWSSAEIYSYARTRGLFGGIALDGSVLSIDRSANALLLPQERRDRDRDFLRTGAGPARNRAAFSRTAGTGDAYHGEEFTGAASRRAGRIDLCAGTGGAENSRGGAAAYVSAGKSKIAADTPMKRIERNGKSERSPAHFTS